MKKFEYSKNDFDISSLPVTRKELFFDIYRNNMKTLTKCGLMLFLFSIPALLFMIFMFFGYMGITEANYGDSYEYMLFIWNVVTPIGFVILFIPILIGISGVIRVIRQLVWQEGIDFKNEFKLGIKQNFKFNFFISLIMIAIFFASDAVLLFVEGFIFTLLPMILFIFIFVPVYFWFLLLVNVYQASFGVYFKNSFYFSFKSIGWSLLFTLLITLPFLIDFIPFQVSPLYISIKYSIITVMLFFYYPCLICILMLFSNSKFDIAINKDLYPEYYRRGLYDLTKEG